MVATELDRMKRQKKPQVYKIANKASYDNINIFEDDR